jgi:hypothetical protein
MAAQQRERMVRGTVEAVNERGVKLAGAWLNFSKFADVARPDVGDEVEVVVKDDRWVNGLKVMGADGQVVSREDYDPNAPFGEAPASLRGPQDDDPGSWGYNAPPKASARVAPVAPAPKTSKASLRAAALAASAHFHSTGDGREEAVYDTAARFLAWIESDD